MSDKLDMSSISYVGPLSEDEYLNVVLGIQKAMAVEPFQPSLVDAVKLLSDWRTLTNEIERLRVELHRVAESRRGQRERADRMQTALLKIEEIVTRPDMASDPTFVVTAVYNLTIEALGNDKEWQR